VAFVLAGIALLLQELDLLALRWSLILPLIVITAGLVVVFSGLVGAHRSRTG
jgi:cytochrome c oxidase subunit IV